MKKELTSTDVINLKLGLQPDELPELKGFYISEQYNGKWSLCKEFYCGGTDVVLDRQLVSNLSKKRADELLQKELKN